MCVSRCPPAFSHCVTLVQYTPNLQDDSDANFNDQAGRMIKMERGCEKVRRMIKTDSEDVCKGISDDYDGDWM